MYDCMYECDFSGCRIPNTVSLGFASILGVIILVIIYVGISSPDNCSTKKESNIINNKHFDKDNCKCGLKYD